MKKLIASGFVLAALLGTTPQISNLTVANTKINNENNLKKLNLTPTDIEYIEKYFNSKTEQEKQELKENLLGAIGLKNDVVTFDKTKLNQKIWDLKIYQIITSYEYLKTLNWYYKNKMLTFDEQGKAHFNTPLLQNFIKGNVWLESYWYWFGYCRLHLDSSSIEAFIDGGAEATEIAQQIAEIPGLDVAAVVIAGIITGYTFTLKSYDYGRGAWFAFYMPIIFIPLGFGSN
ncbi:MAG: hypothetical protein H9Q65_05580 [Spiroplasma ixodetis]|nr:hypothetical protein [Spiroplasma ixodetis]MBP1527058.1 hypothetical protein [Spiroplasma ixodetis]MBP1528694.1 hypothetical protein [Spiroplasma ixodetis]